MVDRLSARGAVSVLVGTHGVELRVHRPAIRERSGNDRYVAVVNDVNRDGEEGRSWA